MQNHKFAYVRKTIDKLTRLLPFLFWTLLIFGFDEPYVAILTILCALLHEGAHATVASLLGGSSLNARLNGFGMKPKKHLSYKEELLLVSAGPAANLIAFFIFILPLWNGVYLKIFALINLLTALSNLIPIRDNDGYRILRCAFWWRERAFGIKLLDTASTLLLFLFCIISLFAVSRLNTGYFAAVTLLFLFTKSMCCSSGGFLREKARKREL